MHSELDASLSLEPSWWTLDHLMASEKPLEQPSLQNQSLLTHRCQSQLQLLMDLRPVPFCSGGCTCKPSITTLNILPLQGARCRPTALPLSKHHSFISEYRRYGVSPHMNYAIGSSWSPVSTNLYDQLWNFLRSLHSEGACQGVWNPWENTWRPLSEVFSTAATRTIERPQRTDCCQWRGWYLISPSYKSYNAHRYPSPRFWGPASRFKPSGLWPSGLQSTTLLPCSRVQTHQSSLQQLKMAFHIVKPHARGWKWKCGEKRFAFVSSFQARASSTTATTSLLLCGAWLELTFSSSITLNMIASPSKSPSAPVQSL